MGDLTVQQEPNFLKISKEINPNFSIFYKEFDAKIIKNIEGLVRGSLEYSDLIAFYKNKLKITECVYYRGWDIKADPNYKIEFHHHPFTLWDIVETVVRRHLAEKNEFNSFDVADEVATLHYSFKVGLMPLSPTVHDLFGEGKLYIHPELAIGDWKSFGEEYLEYLSDDVAVKYDKAISDVSKKNKTDFPEDLREKVTVLKLEYSNDIKLIENLGDPNG